MAPMNNLTPLQEIASRIYCAQINASTYTNGNGEINPYFDSVKLLQESIILAKALLEATKPEHLQDLK